MARFQDAGVRYLICDVSSSGNKAERLQCLALSARSQDMWGAFYQYAWLLGRNHTLHETAVNIKKRTSGFRWNGWAGVILWVHYLDWNIVNESYSLRMLS